MRKFSIRIFTLLLIFFLAFTSYTYAEVSTQDQDFYNELADIGAIMKYITDNYIDNVTYEQLKEAALKGIFSSLDEYSTYFTKEEFSQFERGTSGTFSGTGMRLIEKDGKIVVDSVIEDSPAAKAGVKSGYIIKAVDGKSVEGMKLTDVVNMILGDPGTKVKITFDVGGPLKEIELIRQVIHINPVSYKLLEEGIGYIEITEFNENTTANLTKALLFMDKNNVKKLILDLRNNPGGLLTEVVSAANFFVPQGIVATIESRNGKEDYYSYLTKPKYKLAVLVNKGTASAAEILAGAIQDTKVGFLVGENTYGKGTVQSVVPLEDGSGFKLTIARYKLPSGRYIGKEGLTPDVYVKNVQYTADIKFAGELKIGSRGNEVKILQKYLNLLKFNAGPEDGIFGPKTANAVKELQKKAGLSPTGVFDKNTYNALLKMIDSLNNKDAVLEKALELLRNM